MATKEKLMSYKEMIAPDEVTYVSHHGSLQYPVDLKDEQGNIVTKTLFWKDGRLILNKHSDKDIIEWLDKHWEDQWARDEAGEFKKDPHGIRIRKPNKTEVPYTKYDLFEASILRQPVNVEVTMPFGKKKVVQLTPEILEEIAKKEIQKSKKEEQNEEIKE